MVALMTRMNRWNPTEFENISHGMNLIGILYRFTDNTDSFFSTIRSSTEPFNKNVDTDILISLSYSNFITSGVYLDDQ